MTQPSHSFNLAAYVLAQADQQPDKIAFEIAGADAQTWTYGQLAQSVRRIAAQLLARGAVPGDRILLRLGNTADFPLIYLGAIAAGLVAIPTSTQLTQAEVAAIARQTKPRFVVASAGQIVPDRVPLIAADDLIRTDTGPLAAFHLGDANRPAYIIYTSGTSGKPRAVVHAHRAILARRMMWDDWYGLRADDRMLHAGAFNWTYTLGTGLMDPWAIGATAIIPAPDTPASALPALLKSYRATIFAAAPGVYRRLLRSENINCPDLRHGLSAGEKLPRTIAQAWHARTGTPLIEAYGMSECSTFISSSPQRQTHTLGWPQSGRDVAIIGPDGPVPDGEAGIIGIHYSDTGLMRGYLDAPDETRAKFQHGYFLTGDMGRRMPDGAIAFEGRADDMMNAGGYRVSPIEVEDALLKHPAISEVAAVALRIKADTDVIAAFYVAQDVIDEDELHSFAATTLAGYKRPRIFIRIAALPRGANNKVQRRSLRLSWESQNGQT